MVNFKHFYCSFFERKGEQRMSVKAGRRKKKEVDKDKMMYEFIPEEGEHEAIEVDSESADDTDEEVPLNSPNFVPKRSVVNGF